MDVSDMLDIIHYYFEEDNSRYESGEQADAVSKMRVNLYRLYNQEYKYKITTKKQNGMGGDFSASASNVTKPYIPPTEFDPDSSNPFGGVLDQPLR